MIFTRTLYYTLASAQQRAATRRRAGTRVRDFGPKGRDPAGLFPPGLDSVSPRCLRAYGAEARPRRSRGHARATP